MSSGRKLKNQLLLRKMFIQLALTAPGKVDSFCHLPNKNVTDELSIPTGIDRYGKLPECE